MYKAYCRIYQRVMKVVTDIAPFWRKPELVKGEGAMEQIPALLQRQGAGRVLLVTDVGIVKAGLHKSLLKVLAGANIPCAVFDRTIANPTIANIEEAYTLYRDESCEGILALGGGSVMDCAKGVGIRAVRPNKPLAKMRGLLKVRKRLPPLVAIPTTSGTGSETTLAAVVTDEKTHVKFPINDFSLIPHVAVLDPKLTLGLPPFLTATTGMDALTHAVEAYIGHSNTKQTKKDAIEAVSLIFKYLYKAYQRPYNLAAREAMQNASFLAGAAFTRAYVGYVHAVAHSLGGAYGIAHGLANAVILPVVLELYGESAQSALAELADAAMLALPGIDEAGKAAAFIQAVRGLNQRMDIPDKLEGIRDEDIPQLARLAAKEGNPLYPVPRIMGAPELEVIYRRIMA